MCERAHEHFLGGLFRDAAAHEVEHLFCIEFADGVAVRAFHVVMVDFEDGLHGDACIFAHEDGVHELAGVDARAVVTDNDTSVVAHAGRTGKQVAGKLGACGARGFVVNREAAVLRSFAIENMEAAVIEVRAFAFEVAFDADAANRCILADAGESDVGACGLVDVEVSKTERQIASRICKENFDVGIFANIDVEAFGGNVVRDLVVENFEAHLGVFADFKNGVPEVVVALEHRHFGCAGHDFANHGAGLVCNREEGGEVGFLDGCRGCCGRFRGECVFDRGCRKIRTHKVWSRDFGDREERPKLVIATGHAEFAEACYRLFRGGQVLYKFRCCSAH